MKNTIFVIMKNISITQYAAATGHSRQNILYHLSVGNKLQGIEKAEKIGSTWVLRRDTTRLQKFNKNSLK